MKILVVGGGGREHALVWKLRQSPLVTEVLCAPGNPGMENLARCRDIAVDDIEGLLQWARTEDVGLTAVGPELPLTLGIVDRFQEAGLAIFGPRQQAARLEGSKAFAKEIMAQAGVPTAAHAAFADAAAAKAYVRQQPLPVVIKADGLAAGKGVIIAQSYAEAEAAIDKVLVTREFGNAGDTLVVEEFLAGEEASFFAFTDGKQVLPLVSSQDHKPVFDGDQGPNTGGMGAYSPAAVVTEALHQRIVREVMEPTIAALAAAGCPYTGILYAGLMIGPEGQLNVLEFNARFGDPEAQPLLMRLDSDLVPVLLQCAQGQLTTTELQWKADAAVCVVLAAGGYPGEYTKGMPIIGLEAAAKVPQLEVFHAGTAWNKEAQVVTAGGRVLGVTALGPTIATAVEKAYTGVSCISWEGLHYRQDIGQKAIKREV